MMQDREIQLEEKNRAESKPEGTREKEELNRQIEGLCQSKAKEFIRLGYENVTGEDIWLCVSSQYKDGLPPLHRLINDILSLKAPKYMDWLTVKAFTYQGDNDDLL